MSDEIKGFDRSIEQMMNEHSVSPPFGMWNRISAELDAQPMPLVGNNASAPSSSGMLTTYIAASLFIGASLLAVYFYNSGSTDVILPAVINTSPPTITNIATKQEAIVDDKNNQATVMIIPKRIQKTEAPIAFQTQLPVKHEIVPYTAIAIPPQIMFQDKAPLKEATSVETDDYYFPPVDINIAELKDDALDATNEQAEDDEERNADKKIKSVPGGGDRKIKFKRKKSKGFTYGRLNRLKK